MTMRGTIRVGVNGFGAIGKRVVEAQRQQELATSGPYAHVRHPQYVGFVPIVFGFILQWPTLLTLGMFPVVAWMYARQARSEEGEAYRRYAEAVRAFVPRRSRGADAGGDRG